MEVMTYRVLEFRKEDNDYSSERFISAGGGQLETAPDWIATNPLYDAALAGGALVEMEVLIPKKKKE